VLALVIPVKGPIVEIEVGARNGADLDVLQAAVGGNIEALPLPDFIRGADNATCYIHEEAKFVHVDDDGRPLFNGRATDFLVPGVGLFWGDYIAGPMVVCGFNPRLGVHAELPTTVADRVRLIESEAA
jgi:hypothetical protein